MSTIRSALATFFLPIACFGAAGAFGQTFPAKPVRIWTTPAGGSNDFFVRLIAQGISGPLGQPVVVENRPAAIANEAVAKSPPDGYNLVYAGTTLLLSNILIKTPYDAIKDFSPITLTAIEPSIVVVHPSLPVKSVKELIALAKARPGELNYASGPQGGQNNLATELFMSMAGGLNIVRISYRSGAPSIAALMSGECHMMIVTAGTVAPHIKSGRLRALAVTSAQPTPLAPGLPTVSASGLPGYETVGGLAAMWAPGGTPAAVITRLNQEIVRVLSTPDIKEKYLAAGADVAPTTPEQAAARIKSEIALLAKVIKDAGIRAE